MTGRKAKARANAGVFPLRCPQGQDDGEEQRQTQIAYGNDKPEGKGKG
jgi:hypothetical protein